MEIENWIRIYALGNVGNPPYSPDYKTIHVVFIGNPSTVQLSGTLQELLHDDHVIDSETRCKLHAVVLGDATKSFAKDLARNLETNPEYARDVSFVAGKAINIHDLDRVQIKTAAAAFFLPNKHAANACT